jgi:hypothetical protein
VGLDRSTEQFQDDTGTLAASVQYRINKNFALTFDGLNLNDPTLKYYGANTDSRARSTRTGGSITSECVTTSDGPLPEVRAPPRAVDVAARFFLPRSLPG